MNYNKLKNEIEKNKFTINSISDKIGMTAQGLSAAMKNGTLKIRDLEKIAEILKMNICAFFTEEEKNIVNKSDCEKELRHLQELLAE